MATHGSYIYWRPGLTRIAVFIACLLAVANARAINSDIYKPTDRPTVVVVIKIHI